jgi:hypothetical protein
MSYIFEKVAEAYGDDALDELESLAQEVLEDLGMEKVALSPELKGWAGGERSARTLEAAGLNVKNPLNTLNPKTYKASLEYGTSKKGLRHGGALIDAAKKGQLGQYMEGMSRASKTRGIGAGGTRLGLIAKALKAAKR